MLDPSVLRPSNLQRVDSAIGVLVEEGCSLHIPATFALLLAEGSLPEATAARLFGISQAPLPAGDVPPGDDFGPALATTLSLLSTWVAERPLQPFSITGATQGTLPDWFSAPVRDDALRQILEEEWVFLQTHSMIVSRLKRPFTAFVKAGAVSLEIGVRTLRRLEERTLRLDPALKTDLTTIQHLQAAGKWIGVGGASAATLINPLMSVLVPTAIGWFMLIDP